MPKGRQIPMSALFGILKQSKTGRKRSPPGYTQMPWVTTAAVPPSQPSASAHKFFLLWSQSQCVFSNQSTLPLGPFILVLSGKAPPKVVCDSRGSGGGSWQQRTKSARCPPTRMCLRGGGDGRSWVRLRALPEAACPTLL